MNLDFAILEALKFGPQTHKSLAEITDSSLDSVERAVDRLLARRQIRHFGVLPTPAQGRKPFLFCLVDHKDLEQRIASLEEWRESMLVAMKRPEA